MMSAFAPSRGGDPAGRAATFSPAILGYLRDTLNFGGLVVTDALIMAGASAAQPVPAATVGAVAAGGDALLYPEEFSPAPGAPGGAARGEPPVARAGGARPRHEQAAGPSSATPHQGGPDLAPPPALAA